MNKVYQNRSRTSNLTTRDVAEIAGKIQQARMILDSLSLHKLAQKAGTTKQNLQKMVDRQKEVSHE